MDSGRFSRLCAGVDRLTVGQSRALREKLRALDARIEVLARIDARCDGLDRCRHCGGGSLHGFTARLGARRELVCDDSDARDAGGRSRRRPARQWPASACPRRSSRSSLVVIEDMFAPDPRSCRALAVLLGLDKMTVWRWRMRSLAALSGFGARAITGIVEADEKFFRESRKGSREWVKHERHPALHPEPDRQHWCHFRRLGRLLPAGLSTWQIPVLTVIDSTGARRADGLADRRAERLVVPLEAHVGRDAVRCSDGDSAYGLVARRRAMPHYRFHPKIGPRIIDTAFHIQTVNNLHSRFASFMKPFCGPATKNLPGYTAWFITRLIGPPAEARDAAWQRLLAA